MVAVSTENRIDAHGGVRCSGCEKPMFLVELSPDFGVLVGTLRIRIKHKACGTYNVVLLTDLTYS